MISQPSTPGNFQGAYFSKAAIDSVIKNHRGANGIMCYLARDKNKHTDSLIIEGGYYGQWDVTTHSKQAQMVISKCYCPTCCTTFNFAKYSKFYNSTNKDLLHRNSTLVFGFWEWSNKIRKEFHYSVKSSKEKVSIVWIEDFKKIYNPW